MSYPVCTEGLVKYIYLYIFVCMVLKPCWMHEEPNEILFFFWFLIIFGKNVKKLEKWGITCFELKNSMFLDSRLLFSWSYQKLFNRLLCHTLSIQKGWVNRYTYMCVCVYVCVYVVLKKSWTNEEPNDSLFLWFLR